VELDRSSQEFEVVAQNLTVARSVDAVVIATDGTETNLGTRTADAGGEAKWQFENGALPLGAVTVHDLEGLRIEVRDASTGLVLLVGEIPDLPPTVGEVENE